MFQQLNHPDRPHDKHTPDQRPRLGIVGAGRIGGALAVTLAAQGYTIGAIFSRRFESAAKLAERVAARAVDSAVQVAIDADLIFVCVPDSALVEVCQQISRIDHGELTDRAVVHTSGAMPVSVLNSLQTRGAHIGGLHPFLPVVQPTFAAGGVFGLEAADPTLRDWLTAIVATLGGSALWLPPNVNRARYHAAAVFASNYLVTLFAESLTLLSNEGIDAVSAQNALLHLTRATLDNIERHGPVAALTGPIARGDIQTIRAHLNALPPDLAKLYALLGQHTLPLARGRTADPQTLSRLQELLQTLQEVFHHANDDS